MSMFTFEVNRGMSVQFHLLVSKISSDITELVSHSNERDMKFGKFNNKIILITSDPSFIPVFEKIIDQEGWWQIEIWASFERYNFFTVLYCLCEIYSSESYS